MKYYYRLALEIVLDKDIPAEDADKLVVLEDLNVQLMSEVGAAKSCLDQLFYTENPNELDGDAVGEAENCLKALNVAFEVPTIAKTWNDIANGGHVGVWKGRKGAAAWRFKYSKGPTEGQVFLVVNVLTPLP